MATGAQLRRSCVLIAACVMVIIAMGFTIGGVLSPAWQVVDIKEWMQQHQHGLWLDCVRSDRLAGVRQHRPPSLRTLHCSYKFDYTAAQIVDHLDSSIDGSSASSEAEHHQFYAWHMAMLILIGLTLTMATFSMFIACCAPCFRWCAVIYTALMFFCMVFITIALAVFIINAHFVSNRFVKGLVGTYEQVIGSAFYLTLVGVFFYLLSFLIGIGICVMFLSGGGSGGNNRRNSRYDYEYEQGAMMDRAPPLFPGGYAAPEYKSPPKIYSDSRV